ncbi:MAG: ABC transporter ATP-binding protein/permease [Clostridiales bacterium]|nr:ABC transporter ATP-binding protein/permease [Clostridiales bacterium]
MLNKRLLSLIPDLKQIVFRSVFFKWLTLISSLIITTALCIFINGCLFEVKSPNILIILIVIAVCIILRCCFTYFSVKASTELSQKAKFRLRELVFSHLAKIGSSYSRYVSTAEAVQVSVEGIEQLESYFGAYLPQLFYAAAAPVTLFIFISFLDICSAAVLLVCVPLIPLSIIFVQKIAKRLLSKYWNEYTGLGDTFLENIQGLTTLKIYGADEERHKDMNIKAENFRKATMRVLIMQLNSISVMDIVAYGGAAAGIITMLYRFAAGKTTFLSAVIIILISSEFFIPVRQLGSFFHIAMNGSAAADKIFKILDTEIPKRGSEGFPENSDVKFENLCFSYEDNKETLKNINLETKTTGLYSFAGMSGCGKSTMAALLTGRLTDYSGSLKIGGTEINHLSEKALSETVTLIEHNSHIFKGTIKSNLQAGKKTTTEEEILTALKSADLSEFSTDEGLNRPVSEEGSNLSGGQRQRLALARALLHDTPIYIFDEATSNIDAESEETIMKNVRRLSETRLVILISHRLENLRGSENIFVLNNGEIKERGKFEELIDRKGLFADMYGKQKYYEDYASGGVQNEKE